VTPAAYAAEVRLIGSRVSAMLLRRWSTVDRANIAASWRSRLADAVAIVTAGQLAAARLADPYLDATVGPGDGAALVVPQALAGRTLEGRTLEGLLDLPRIEALTLVGQDVSAATALRRAGASLALYGRTATADSARQAVVAGMGARRVAGYYRRLNLPSCARCVILAGRWYRVNQGFNRHPGCDCVHVPGDSPGDGPGFDARRAILDGQVRGLSAAETEAIRLGADPSQVVNARRGMSTVGGRRVTTEGTTRRGIAGARILAAEADRVAGLDVAGATYRNVTMSRERAAELVDAMRRGQTFTRRIAGGRTQTAAYRRTRTARPTPEQILADATSQDAAIRALINNGYII
jgi:hypothetical protein